MTQEIQVQEPKYFHLVSGMVLAKVDGQVGQTTVSTITATHKASIGKLQHIQFHEVLSQEFYKVLTEDLTESDTPPEVEILKITVETVSPYGLQTEEEFNADFEDLMTKMDKPLEDK